MEAMTTAAAPTATGKTVGARVYVNGAEGKVYGVIRALHLNPRRIEVEWEDDDTTLEKPGDLELATGVDVTITFEEMAELRQLTKNWRDALDGDSGDAEIEAGQLMAETIDALVAKADVDA